jgi:succinoglycan biosynthesis transport protein ExoP
LSIRDLAHALRRHAVLFLVCVLLAVGPGAYFALSATPSYMTRTQLFVSSTGTTSVAALLQNNNLVLDRIPSYVTLVNSPLVVKPVVQRLGLQESPEAVALRITASNPLDTAVIDVIVRDATAQGAYRLAVAIGEIFGTVVQGIETAANGRSPVKITVVRPPGLPATPDSSGTVRHLVMALLLGLGLGTTAVVLRDRADTTVREPEDLRTTLDMPPLAIIGVDSRAVRSPLMIEAGTPSSRGEGFRRLRTNLQVLISAEELRSVLVTGPLTDDNSSTVARNLAAAFSLAQVRVLLIESDMRDGHAASLLGVDGRRGLSDVLVGRVGVEEAIQPWREGRVHVLPAGPSPSNPSELLASEVMRDLIAKLEREYDLLLVDAPSLLGTTDATVLAMLVNGTLLTVRRDRTRWDTVRRAVQALHDVNARTLGAVVLCRQSRWTGRGNEPRRKSRGFSVNPARLPFGSGRAASLSAPGEAARQRATVETPSIPIGIALVPSPPAIPRPAVSYAARGVAAVQGRSPDEQRPTDPSPSE